MKFPLQKFVLLAICVIIIFLYFFIKILVLKFTVCQEYLLGFQLNYENCIKIL